MKIALLGAESTGKSELAQALVAHLRAEGQDAILVPEYLRHWCNQHARTPTQAEQAHIAQQQQAHIEEAAAAHDWVIADTTALMTAIYSAHVFSDTNLYSNALAQQRRFDITLLTGLDLPWQADGIQRDGAHIRPVIDGLLRQALTHAGIAFQVIYGSGIQRLCNALRSLPLPALARPEQACTIALDEAPRPAPWQSVCERCSNPECEHRLFARLCSARASLPDALH